MANTLSRYDSAEELFFGMPLYKMVGISSDQLFKLHSDDLRIDGYCPYCPKARVFVRDKAGWSYDQITNMKSLRFGR
jgi:hypothetical protein